jgi:hypothetical protein
LNAELKCGKPAQAWGPLIKLLLLLLFQQLLQFSPHLIM